jgi:hypothetical protein
VIGVLVAQPWVLAALMAVSIVSLAGLIAYLVVCVDWFAANDFTESELQARIDATFKEKS